MLLLLKIGVGWDYALIGKPKLSGNLERLFKTVSTSQTEMYLV